MQFSMELRSSFIPTTVFSSIVLFRDEGKVVDSGNLLNPICLSNLITITSCLRKQTSFSTCCNSSLKTLQAISRSSSPLSSRMMLLKLESILSSALVQSKIHTVLTFSPELTADIIMVVHKEPFYKR
uniref:Uncharacterized protein n=1 Tax=Solanum lycopersicum TaxID=4081 RepID=A0A3Q7HE27_SOLLC